MAMINHKVAKSSKPSNKLNQAVQNISPINAQILVLNSILYRNRASKIDISEKIGGTMRIIWNSLSFSAKKIIILSGREKIATRSMLLFEILSFKSFIMAQLQFYKRLNNYCKNTKKNVSFFFRFFSCIQ